MLRGLVYSQLVPFSEWVVSLAPFDPGSHLGESLSFFVYDTPKVLMLLTLVVFGMGVVRSFFSPEKTRELLACMIKGIERVSPMLKFKLSGVEVRLHGVRQDAPPRMVSVDYALIVDTDESDQRLELLHTNVLKYGTISNTVAEAIRLEGVIKRRA